MEMSGQLDAPCALPLGKELPVAIELEAGGAQALVKTLWRGEKSWPTGNLTRAIQPVVRRYADWAILIPLIENIIVNEWW
jgi:hypothetical protein